MLVLQNELNLQRPTSSKIYNWLKNDRACSFYGAHSWVNGQIVDYHGNGAK